MLQNLKAAERNVPHCTQPRSCEHVAAPKTDPCPAHFSQATRCREPAVPSAGGRHPEICRRQVCVRCHRKKKDVQAILCSGGKLVSVYGPMLHLSHAGDVFGSYAPASSASQESELGSEGYERPALPRQPDRPLNAFTWQFDPSQDRRNPGSRFAINNLASQRPECHDADNPSWDVPNNRQPCSDNGSAHVPSCKNGLGQ